ncbi:MAG: Bug family tripartite tricarboxylate transporter substrate binding protein [Lautropia sp.]
MTHRNRFVLALRRHCLLAALPLAAALASVPAGPAVAAEFPVAGKPIRIVVPFPPGGQTDLQARVVAPLLGEAVGASVVVENKPGGNMVIAVQDVIRAAPDGHTLLYANAPAFTRNPFLFNNLPYDPFKDFTPVSQFVQALNVLTAHPDLPANDVKQLVAYAKSSGRPLKYGTAGLGSNSQVLMELLRSSAGIELVAVPYKGTADAARDLMAGVIDLYIDGTQTAVQNAKAGKVKMLGITGTKRLDVLPELATFVEQGFPAMNIIGWIGFFGPAGMPADVTARLQAELAKIAQRPEVAQMIRTGGNEPYGSSSAELAASIRSEYDRMNALFKELKIQKIQ